MTPQSAVSRARILSPRLLVLLAAAILLAAPAAPAAPAAAAPRLDPATQAWKIERSLAPAPAASVPGDGSNLVCEWLFAVNRRAHFETAGQHLWPDIAAGPDGTIAIAWMDDHRPGEYHIFYTYSTDGGATWAAAEQVDTRTTGDASKFVDLDFTPEGIPVAVWEDDRAGAINVYLSKRDPAAGGVPWTPNVRINTAGSSPGPSDFMNASLAVLDDTRYFVAWTDWREGPFHQVYVRGTADGGDTWGAETRVSDGLGFQPVAGDPCLIADPLSGPPGEEILSCVANDWRGDVPGGRYPNAYFYRSADGGATWSAGIQVNDIEPYYQQVSSHALVQLTGGALTAGWLNNQDLLSHHLRTSVSTDQGATWQASAQADPPSPGGTGTYSSIAAHDGWVFAGFDLLAGNWDAYFRASSDGGRTWTEDACRMDDDSSGGAAQNTVLAPVTTEIVHGAWSDTRPGLGSWKIYTSRGERGATGIADPPPAPATPVGLSSAPNPSRIGEPVRIEVRAPAVIGGGSRLLICDAAGRAVSSLALPPGGVAHWDGRDRAGRMAPPGIYWIQLAAPAGAATPRGRVVRLP
jgi:hypothetical protein